MEHAPNAVVKISVDELADPSIIPKVKCKPRVELFPRLACTDCGVWELS
jgi:hypothetical protein